MSGTNSLVTLTSKIKDYVDSHAGGGGGFVWWDTSNVEHKDEVAFNISMLYDKYYINRIIKWCYCTFPLLPALMDAGSMFNGCSSLTSVTLPAMPALTNAGYMFNGCSSLTSVTLPAMPALKNAGYMFYSCSRLTAIENLENLGSKSTPCTMRNIIYNDDSSKLPLANQTLTLGAMISKLEIYGSSSTARVGITGLRLTNANSTFGGSSPQIRISNCNLEAAALDTLFGDLPTVSGKTIQITGNPGAATCDTSIATAKGWTVTR